MAIFEDLILKYSDTPLTSLLFDVEDTDLIYLSTKKFIELQSNEVVSAKMLNGRNVEHPKFVNSNLSIIVSTDSLIRDELFIHRNNRFNYLKSWWNAKHKYIARIPALSLPTYTGELNHYLASEYAFQFDETATINFFEVITGGGVFPISFINEMDLFPEFTLNLTRVLPL